MIDDDFRSLNHKDYIGCFCELHVEATNKILAKTLDSSMLLQGVYNDKTIRGAWMHANFEGQKHVASLIGSAIHKVNRNIQVGLMNSGEENHSIQGRDMDLLIACFANGNKKISRPMGGAYFDSLHLPLIGTLQSMALSISILTDTEIVSEIENWPHTRMTKSISQTYTQMKLHALAGAAKLSLNIFDYMATPYNQERLFIDLLKNKKSVIEKIIAERKGKKQIGVGLLWDQAVSLHTEKNLMPERMIDTLLPSMGIVTTFHEGKINFLMGSVSKSMADVDIKRLLSKNLFLDSDAVLDLLSRGYSEYLGITLDGYINTHSMERINDTKYAGIFTDNLVPTNYLREVNDDRKLPKLINQKSTVEVTSLLDLEQNYYSPGITLFKNNLGGMICNMVSPISLWAYAYRSRAFIFREIVKDMDTSSNFVIENSINTAPFLFEDKNSSVFALLNSGLDEELCFVPYLNKEVRLNPLELKIYMNKEEYNE